MNSPILTEMNVHIPAVSRRSRRLLPSPLAWVKALCLLPLAIPGVRVVMSGLSWFTWLNFPLSWLVATVMFIMMHLIVPVLILAGLYHLTRSLWPSETPRSPYQTWWFAVSTLTILVLSFLGTVGIAALAELSICRLPQLTMLIGSCSNHFVSTELKDLAASIETYNFHYYNWLVWMVITAYLYQLENHLRVNKMSPITDRLENYQPSEVEDMSHPSVDNLGREFLDETA